jgi:hypothetical protein
VLSTEREWLTEREIKSVVHGEMRDEFGRLENSLEKIRDGAQASIYSATILHGNPEIGLKGAIPDIQERLEAVEEREKARDSMYLGWHDSNTGRLDKLEIGQHRIRKFVGACFRFATTKQGEEPEDGKSKLSWWRIATLAGAFGSTWHWLAEHVPLIAKKLSAAIQAMK